MLDYSSVWTFLLIFVRITTFMVTVPVFSGRQIPASYKIGISAVLSFLCVGMSGKLGGDVSQSMIFLLIFKEFLVGLVLGMAASFLFYAVQFAGSLLDLQIGFSMASLFDPTFETSTQLTGRLKNILALLFLLSTNGHHLLIQGILASFQWVPLQAALPSWMDGRLSTMLLECLQQMFMIGFMMALPILGTLLVVDAGLGIIARTVPQMNMFAIFPPIKILIHFLMYLLVLPGFFYLLKVLCENMFDSIHMVLRIMGA